MEEQKSQILQLKNALSKSLTQQEENRLDKQLMEECLKGNQLALENEKLQMELKSHQKAEDLLHTHIKEQDSRIEKLTGLLRLFNKKQQQKEQSHFVIFQSLHSTVENSLQRLEEENLFN